VNPSGLDIQALAVALVLDPATFSRNRFYELYDDPAVRRVRRRAALLRSLIKQLAMAIEAGGLRLESRARADLEELRFEIPALGLRRRTLLDSTESALVRFALDRRVEVRPLPPDLALRSDDEDLIHGALVRLVGPVSVCGDNPPAVP
jgi:hypothetical protein